MYFFCLEDIYIYIYSENVYVLLKNLFYKQFMKRSMMVNNDIRHDKEKLEFLGKKVIHYQYHAQFLNVCL